MDKVRLFFKPGQINKCDWYVTDAYGVDCPITVKMEFNGWRPLLGSNCEDSFDFEVESYGKKYTVRIGYGTYYTADNGQCRLWGIYTNDDMAVEEFFIHAKHPIAHVFHKTCMFDGVEYLVPIGHMEPRQPY